MPRHLPDRRQVASWVGYLLRRAHFEAADCMAMYAGFDPKAGAILELIRSNGPVSQQWLSEYLDLNRSVMVKLIDGLEQSGHVARKRNLQDRRSYALEVTTAGRRRLRQLEVLAREVTAQLTRRLSPEESRRLDELLNALLAPLFDPPLPELLRRTTGFLVAQAQHRFSARLDDVLGPLGLSTRTFVALAVLGTGEPWAQHELAAWLFIGPAATVELVDELESLGAVRRERSTTDRRSYALVVTDKGRALAEAAIPTVRSTAESFTEHLGEDANEELVNLLARLVGLEANATATPRS